MLDPIGYSRAVPSVPVQLPFRAPSAVKIVSIWTGKYHVTGHATCLDDQRWKLGQFSHMDTEALITHALHASSSAVNTMLQFLLKLPLSPTRLHLVEQGNALGNGTRVRADHLIGVDCNVDIGNVGALFCQLGEFVIVSSKETITLNIARYPSTHTLGWSVGQSM